MLGTFYGHFVGNLLTSLLTTVRSAHRLLGPAQAQKSRPICRWPARPAESYKPALLAWPKNRNQTKDEKVKGQNTAARRCIPDSRWF